MDIKADCQTTMDHNSFDRQDLPLVDGLATVTGVVGQVRIDWRLVVGYLTLGTAALFFI